MPQTTRWPIFLLIAVIACVLSFFAGMAVQQNRSQTTTGGPAPNDTAAIANRFLDQLETAYNTQDIPSMVSLYDDPTAGIDVTRNDYRFYTTSVLSEEFEKAIKGGNLTGIRCTFTNRETIAAGDMIMIRTLRSVTANELPKSANCLMLLILKKQFVHGKFQGCVITNQIMLKEEYVSK